MAVGGVEDGGSAGLEEPEAAVGGLGVLVAAVGQGADDAGDTYGAAMACVGVGADVEGEGGADAGRVARGDGRGVEQDASAVIVPDGFTYVNSNGSTVTAGTSPAARNPATSVSDIP